MQRALATSSPTCLSSAAEQILQGSDVSYDTAQQGHRALARLIDGEKDGIQHAEVLQMLRVSLSGPNPQSEAPEDTKHRSKHVLRLLQQLQSKQKLSVLQSPEGDILTEEEAIAGELCRYWGGVMTPT